MLELIFSLWNSDENIVVSSNCVANTYLRASSYQNQLGKCQLEGEMANDVSVTIKLDGP